MTEIDKERQINTAEWYLDPNEVEAKVSEMSALVDETVAKYPNLPGLKNRLDEQLYESSAALRLTAQEETQKLVEDQVTGKLQQIAGHAGWQGKFQEVYLGMANTIAPFATALGGPNATRDLLTKNFDSYFKTHYKTISNFPNPTNVELLQSAILNADMQSIISPETMAGAITTHKQMIEALRTKGDPSEYAKRQKALQFADKYRKEHNMPPMEGEDRMDFYLYGDREKLDPTKLSKKEERTELLNWADPTGKTIPEPIRREYKLTGKISEGVDAKIDARKAKIDKMNEERVTAGLPKFSERIYNHFVLGGVLLDDSPLDKAKAEIAYIEKPVAEGGLGIKLDEVQKKSIISKNYSLSGAESAEFKVEEATAIMNPGKPEDEQVPLTTPQLEKVADLDDKSTKITLNTGEVVESAYGKGTGAGLAEETNLIIKEKRLAQQNLGRLQDMKSLLQTEAFKPGALARPRLYVGRLVEFLHEAHPSTLTETLLKGVGKPAFGEAYDKLSKEMLLLMAKYVGRITNLSLNFARDTVPGLLKTKEGNLLIIALMERADRRKIELGTIEEKYALAGTPTPEGEPTLFAARDKYHKDHPFIDAKLKAAIAKARPLLSKTLQNALKEKNLRNIFVDPPKANNKDFLAYLQKYNITMPFGTKYTGTVNGMHRYVHPDGKGTDIPVYWDDKKSSTVTDTPPVNPPSVTKPPSRGLVTDENNTAGTFGMAVGGNDLGQLTLNDIVNATPEDVEQFWAENETEIKKQVAPEIIDAIVEIVNEVRKP